MASTTDIREWARGIGLEVGPKGPLPDDVKARYAQAHPDPGDLEPDDPGADVTGAAAPPSAPAAEDTRQAERRPARPPAARSAGRGVLGWFRGRAEGAGKAKPRPKGAGGARRVARVSIANLIEDAWSQMAWAASSMPPMQRLLQAQAPFAGIALEDGLAGTVVDRALQPVARAEDKAKAVGGLMCPPMALMMVLTTAPAPTVIADPTTGEETMAWPEPSTAHKAALMSFRWSLMLWAEAGNARLEEYQERAAASEERGRQADKFMAFILGIPEQAAEDATAEAVSAEADAIARAQAMFGGPNGADGPVV